MDICQLIKEQEKTKSDFEKLKLKLIDLNYDIDKYCESKIGYVVEQFGDKFYITKYSKGFFLGLKIRKEDNKLNGTRTIPEIIFPDSCKFIGKGRLIGNKVDYIKL